MGAVANGRDYMDQACSMCQGIVGRAVDGAVFICLDGVGGA